MFTQIKSDCMSFICVLLFFFQSDFCLENELIKLYENVFCEEYPGLAGFNCLINQQYGSKMKDQLALINKCVHEDIIDNFHKKIAHKNIASHNATGSYDHILTIIPSIFYKHKSIWYGQSCTTYTYGFYLHLEYSSPMNQYILDCGSLFNNNAYWKKPDMQNGGGEQPFKIHMTDASIKHAWEFKIDSMQSYQEWLAHNDTQTVFQNDVRATVLMLSLFMLREYARDTLLNNNLDLHTRKFIGCIAHESFNHLPYAIKVMIIKNFIDICLCKSNGTFDEFCSICTQQLGECEKEAQRKYQNQIEFFKLNMIKEKDLRQKVRHYYLQKYYNYMNLLIFLSKNIHQKVTALVKSDYCFKAVTAFVITVCISCLVGSVGMMSVLLLDFISYYRDQKAW